MKVTRWNDRSPLAKPKAVTMPLKAWQVPERGDDAALRQTLVALRNATTIDHKAMQHVEASPYVESAQRHGPGGVYFVKPGLPNVEANRRRANPGEWVIVTPMGDVLILTDQDFGNHVKAARAPAKRKPKTKK